MFAPYFQGIDIDAHVDEKGTYKSAQRNAAQRMRHAASRTPTHTHMRKHQRRMRVHILFYPRYICGSFTMQPTGASVCVRGQF